MSTSPRELDRFVRDALSRGLERAAVRQAMVDAGWSVEQARTALDAYAETAFPVPVPRPRVQLSAREAFLYLVLFTTLYLSCYHLGSILFDLINRAYPDAADRALSLFGRDSLRWSVSWLAVAFPLFVFLSRHLARAAALHPMMRLSPVRRWLTYLTLFLAVTSVIGDLAVLVYNVLGGELTTRITLKVLVVFAISAAVFGYYLSDLKREERE